LAQVRLDTLFDEHHQRLYRLARRLTASPDDAADLVQETFLRAVAHAGRIPAGREREEAWLVRVMVNVTRDHGRRRRVRERERHRIPESGTAPSPEGATVAKQAVEAALAGLKPRRRAVVVLCALEELSTREAAALLGMAEVTVRWHLSRAYKELAARFAARPEDGRGEETKE